MVKKKWKKGWGTPGFKGKEGVHSKLVEGREGWGEGSDLADTPAAWAHKRLTRKAEGKSSQPERAESRAEWVVEEMTKCAGCQAICTGLQCRWAKRCKFFWEDLNSCEKIPERHSCLRKLKEAGSVDTCISHLSFLQNYCRCMSKCV